MSLYDRLRDGAYDLDPEHVRDANGTDIPWTTYPEGLLKYHLEQEGLDGYAFTSPVWQTEHEWALHRDFTLNPFLRPYEIPQMPHNVLAYLNEVSWRAKLTASRAELDEARRAYEAKELTPHVYALVSDAYKRLCTQGASQALVTSGESGSGKTETTKAALKLVSAMALSAAAAAGSGEPAAFGTPRLEARLLQTSPVLEAFGNAKTVRNHNSSRFGKLVVLQCTSAGALASCCLLYTSPRPRDS